MSLQQLLQQAGENFLWLILASAFPAILIWLVWTRLPKYVQRALKALDNLLPGDFSALYRPASVVIDVGVTIVILVPVATAML